MDHTRPSSVQSVGSGSTGQSSLVSCGVMDATGTDPTRLPILPLHRQIPQPNEAETHTARISSIPPLFHRNGMNQAPFRQQSSGVDLIKYRNVTLPIVPQKLLLVFTWKCPKCDFETEAMTERRVRYLGRLHKAGSHPEDVKK